MRKKFEVQYEMGTPRIEEVEIPLNSRDELPPVLRALQYVYTTPEYNIRLFDILSEKIIDPIQKTGRYGMSLWEIAVFATLRLALDIDFDRLHHIVNFDSLVRSLLGISTFGISYKHYSLQSLKDNWNLLDEEMIMGINDLIIEAGHAMLGLNEVEVKIDSYALETNVHFPTDANLLWDGARKCCDLTKQIIENEEVKGMRKLKDWKKRIRNAFLKVTRVRKSKAKDKEARELEATEEYISIARNFSARLVECDPILLEICAKNSVKREKYDELAYYFYYLHKQIDLLERRIIFGEKISHCEKVHSLFEPYTEWIQKGKAGNKVELGLRISIATDQNHFILSHRVMEKEQDVDVAVLMVEKISKKYSINSASFDKGYWSKENYEKLEKDIPCLIMPKKGKRNKDEEERENCGEFKALKKRHSAVESNINCLEHHGLNRCPDKGLKNFKKYVAVGILAYNLHKLGNILLKSDRELVKAQAA